MLNPHQYKQSVTPQAAFIDRSNISSYLNLFLTYWGLRVCATLSHQTFYSSKLVGRRWSSRLIAPPPAEIWLYFRFSSSYWHISHLGWHFAFDWAKKTLALPMSSSGLNWPSRYLHCSLHAIFPTRQEGISLCSRLKKRGGWKESNYYLPATAASRISSPSPGAGGAASIPRDEGLDKTEERHNSICLGGAHPMWGVSVAAVRAAPLLFEGDKIASADSCPLITPGCHERRRYLASLLMPPLSRLGFSEGPLRLDTHMWCSLD